MTRALTWPRTSLAVVLVALSVASTASTMSMAGAASEPVPGIGPGALFPWASFDPAIPTQEQVTGVVPGARPLRHDELLRYFEKLAEASPRASLHDYATSWEGRRLVYLAVSDEATQGRLDAFRAEHAALVDPRRRPATEDAAALSEAKAVAWMAYAIHGDELSSTDAAAALAYWLVAGQDERARRLRRELVILIDPLENPDGRERFLAQTRSFAHARPNPDIEDLSHATVWPRGRGNHYLFDLNRDWFTQVQPESARSSVIASWEPQLVVDAHEMGPNDTYLFPPPRHPFNPFLPPDELEWLDRFAADQAHALDARGYAYYTREWNEEFFPGYGSSWAVYRGAIGILYEMSSTQGTLVKQRAGTVRTYPQAVEHQVTSSVANLETLVRNRAAILLDFVAGRRRAIQEGTEGEIRAWILPPGRHPDRTAELAALLRRQGIEVVRAAAPVRATGLHDAWTGETLERELPAGSWMVALDQPAGRLVRVLLDPHVPMGAQFLREEREYLERGKGTRLYDTTAWSLPLAYGVEAYWASAKPRGSWEAAAPTPAAGALEGAGPAYGYLLDGLADRSCGALADLLERGIAVRVADKPFGIGGRSYDRGTLLIKREGNPDDLADVLREVAERWKVKIRATPTAKAGEGPDLGGSHFLPLVSPRVGVWSASPVSPSAYGAIWYLLDREIDLRFSGLDLSRAGRTDLARYNVLVFPSVFGGGAAYRQAFGERGIDRLRRWIEAGGTAIGIGTGADFLADKDLALVQTRLRRQVLDRYLPVVLGVDAEDVVAGGPLRAAGLRAPQPETEAGKPGASSTKRATSPARTERASPYDIAPVLGAGARPFARAVELGTPAPGRPVSLERWIVPLLPAGEDKPSSEDLERADERLRRFAPQGALLRVELDPELWLDWGMPGDVAVWIGTRDTLVAEPPVQVAARFPGVDRLHLGGLLWPEAAARLAHTAYATREGVGRGQVILYLDDPVFRGWMRDTRRQFVNALLYGPGLGTRWSSPW